MSGADPTVVVRAAAAGERGAIASLLQMYLHDLSEFSGEAVGADGTFAYPYLDRYWVEPERHAFLILADGAPAGFALVRRDGDEHELAEFFILRAQRRRGVGAAAAVALLERFPGAWRIAQEAANVPAQAFWRGLLNEITHGRYTQAWSDSAPRGPVQRFVWPPPG